MKLAPGRAVDVWILLQASVLVLLQKNYVTPAVVTGILLVRWLVPSTLSLSVSRQRYVAAGIVAGVIGCHVAIGWSEPGMAWFSRLLCVIADSALLLQVAWRLLGASNGSIATWIGPAGLATLYVALSDTFDAYRRAEAMLLATACLTWFVVIVRMRTHLSSGTSVKRREPRGLVFMSLVSAALITWPLADTMNRQVQSIQQWITDAVTLNVTQVENSRSYVRVASLRSVLREQTNNPTQVALRVFSERAPGYLRSRAYDVYIDSQWRSFQQRRWRRDRFNDYQILKPTAQPPLGIPTPEEDFRVFEILPLSRSPWSAFEVWNDPVRGELFFLPVNAAFVEGAGEYIAVDINQVVRTGISVERPYTAYVPRFAPRVRLAAADRQRLLAPIDGLDPGVRKLANELAEGADSSRAKMQAVEDFFGQNFKYSLKEVPIPPKVNAISYFISTRPAAHCEFFASGAVAILRLMNIPCRYVTGYVVRESSEYGDYWIARNQNAHAWVEAYDDATQRWVTLEPTPGMADEEANRRVITLDSKTSSENSLSEVLRLSRYWLEPRWRHVWLSALARWLAKPISFVIACAIILFVVRLGRRRRATRSIGMLGSRPRGPYRRFLKALRRYQLQRSSAETLHQFASRIRAHEPLDEFLIDAAMWLEEYAQQRYTVRRDGAHDPLRIPPSRHRTNQKIPT